MSVGLDISKLSILRAMLEDDLSSHSAEESMLKILLYNRAIVKYIDSHSMLRLYGVHSMSVSVYTIPKQRATYQQFDIYCVGQLGIIQNRTKSDSRCFRLCY